MLPRRPTVDWTLTQYETALVRVRLHALGATTTSAELTLSTRCRRRRFTELPRPAVAGPEDALPDVAATFEVPVAMLYRKGLRARITAGPIHSPLDWSELAHAAPLPAAEFAPGGAWPNLEVSRRRALLRAVQDEVPPRRRPAPLVTTSERAPARAEGHDRTDLPLAPPPKLGGRPRPDGAPPIAVDSTLLQFLPYEQAAPRLAMPISLSGDVLTVAVALPSVDLSFITDRSPWLRIEREVTGYHRIVQALREVEAMDDRRAASPAVAVVHIPELDGVAASSDVADAAPWPVLEQPAEPILAALGSSAAGSRPLLATAAVRRLRAIADRVRARSDARARQPGFAGALVRLARARQRHAAVAAVAGVAITAVLIAISPAPAGTADAAARAALDTAACIGALVVAYLALACYRLRRSAASLALVLGAGALAVTAVLAVTALRGEIPGPDWASGGAFAAAASSVALQALAVVVMAGAAFALAVTSRRSDDDLLVWCSIGAIWLAVAHVNALLAPQAGGQVSAADVFRLAAVASFLIGAAREIAAHGPQLASVAVAAERRRMARELHDGVAQELAFIVSQASSLARHERPAGPLQSIALAGERALIDSRRSIHKLTRPDASTLHEAITEQASQWAKRAGLQLEVQMPREVKTSPEMQHAILRIVQEAISNAVRHAGATRVMVSLSEHDGSVTVRISDDGRGFEAQPRDPEQSERGFGLVSMAERAEAFGGQLRLESEPGRGTVVEVAFR